MYPLPPLFTHLWPDACACPPPCSHRFPGREFLQSDPQAAKAIRGVIRGFWRIAPLAPSVCQVTYLGQATLGGRIPKIALNLRVKSSLQTVAKLQEMMHRSGKVVDGEIRAAFPLPPLTTRLTDEQQEIIAKCGKFERNDTSSATSSSSTSTWTQSRASLRDYVLGGEAAPTFQPLPSPSPFVKMWIKHAPSSQGGERRIALGKASCTIDASALETLAFIFDFCGRERMRINVKEQGDPARLVLKHHTKHDMVIANLKKMPRPLHTREFVNRGICAQEMNGDLVFAFAPTDDTVDYGMKSNAVRGLSRVFMRFTPVSASQCEVRLYQYLDAGGHVPSAIVNSKIPIALGALEETRALFQKDAEIDAAELAKATRAIYEEPQTYTREEMSQLREGAVNLAELRSKPPESIEPPEYFATATVDTAIEECAAFGISKLSRREQRQHFAEDGLERSLTVVNAHSSTFRVVRRLDGAQPREFLMRCVWKWKDAKKEELLLSYETVDDGEVDPRYIRAMFSSMWTFTMLKEVGEVRQTLVTVGTRINFGPNAPKRATIGLDTSGVQSMKQHFDRSFEVDRATRRELVTLIGRHARENALYSEYEKAILAEGEQYFTEFNKLQAKTLEMASSLTKAKIAFKAKDSHAWGWATTTVQASAAEVLAFVWDSQRRSAWKKEDLERNVEESPNSHNKLVYVQRKAPNKLVKDREFLGRYIWRREKGGDFLYVIASGESEGRPIRGGVVRAKNPSAMRIKRKSDHEAHIEYVIHPDAGGKLPSVLMNAYLSRTLAVVSEARAFFQAQRGLAKWTPGDGRAVGDAMVSKTKEEKHDHWRGKTRIEARLRKLFAEVKGLAEVEQKYEFFPAMMVRVVQNKLRNSGVVNSKLVNVSVKDGVTIGGGLAVSLATNQTAEAACDEWIQRYPGLQEVDRAEAWFR